MITYFPETQPVGEVYEVTDHETGELVGYGTDIWGMTTVYWIEDDPEVARIACEELAHAYAELQ